MRQRSLDGWKDWFAELASIAVLEQRPADERRCLAERLLALADGSPIEFSELPPLNGRELYEFEAQRRNQPTIDYVTTQVLPDAHRLTHDLVVKLLNPHQRNVLITVPERQVSLSLQGGVIRESGGSRRLLPIHHRKLHEVLAPGSIFVFTRCDVCERIFARRGRAKRCSGRCRDKYHNDLRFGTAEHREQNRQAAKRYRERRAGPGPADPGAAPRRTRRASAT